MEVEEEALEVEEEEMEVEEEEMEVEEEAMEVEQEERGRTAPSTCKMRSSQLRLTRTRRGRNGGELRSVNLCRCFSPTARLLIVWR